MNKFPFLRRHPPRSISPPGPGRLESMNCPRSMNCLSSPRVYCLDLSKSRPLKECLWHYPASRSVFPWFLHLKNNSLTKMGFLKIISLAICFWPIDSFFNFSPLESRDVGLIEIQSIMVGLIKLKGKIESFRVSFKTFQSLKGLMKANKIPMGKRPYGNR